MLLLVVCYQRATNGIYMALNCTFTGYEFLRSSRMTRIGSVRSSYVTFPMFVVMVLVLRRRNEEIIAQIHIRNDNEMAFELHIRYR